MQTETFGETIGRNRHQHMIKIKFLKEFAVAE